MTDEAALRARAAERCRCGHERAYHDACSRCLCPFFLPPGEKNAGIVKGWRAAKAEREEREGGE